MPGSVTEVVHPDGRRAYVSAEEVAPLLVPFALMCAHSYGREAPGVRTHHEPVETRGLPAPAGWARCEDTERFVEGCRQRLNVGGLALNVWRSDRAPAGPAVAIVFRGTARVPDWVANLNWLLARRLPFIPDRYSQLRSLLVELQDDVERRFPGATVVAAGHSLGGGLAQHAAYAGGRIKEVYSFNSSPVTGYFSIPRHERQRNRRALTIHRVSERGEVLAFVRGPIRLLRSLVRCVVAPSPDSVAITEYRFNVERVTFRMLSQHSIEALARHLHACAESKNTR